MKHTNLAAAETENSANKKLKILCKGEYKNGNQH